MSEPVPVRRHLERPPIRAALPGTAAAAVVLGAVWVWVAFETPGSARALVAIVGAITGILLCAAVFLAIHRTQELRQVRDDTREFEDRAVRQTADLARLADHTMPTAVSMLREGASPDSILAEIPRQADQVHGRILRTLVGEIGVGERRRAAATAACANAAGRVQALSTSMLADLRDLENRCPDEVLGDLLKLDHSTAQAGRIADSIAVLTGARSGRRWTKPIKMESILRGAMGRIGAYQRIRLHYTSSAAVAGYAAEDVMHALAELMDNATKFSAPSEEVHVYVEDLHSGVVMTIEDGGLGMNPQALERAEAAVSSTRPLDLTTLSGTRLGLAVVGCLARKHNLQVFFRPSSRGGIGVVLRIPSQLITQARQEAPQMPPAPRHRPAAPAAIANVPSSRNSADDVQSGGSGSVATVERGELPRRPPGQTMAAAARPQPQPRPQTPRPPADSGSRFGAFRQGLSKTPEGEPPTGDGA